MASLFYEPSTGTRLSFEAAAHRLGMSVLSSADAAKDSSAAKGETLADAIRRIDQYCNLIVLRHPDEASAQLAASVSRVPVVNCGNGKREHPSQTMLDLYTMWSDLEKLYNLKIAFVGDLENGRTVHSLARGISMFRPEQVFLVSPEELMMPFDFVTLLQSECKSVVQTTKLDESILRNVDVVYMTRVQKERFTDQAVYERLKGSYVFGRRQLEQLQAHAIVMHPLPRVDELDPACDRFWQAAYFRQAGYGVRVRMAIIAHLLGL